MCVDGVKGKAGYYNQMSNTIIVDCLLPKNVIVPLSCQRDITLAQLKEELWREARKYKGQQELRAPRHYVLVGVTQDAAAQEEFWDEERRLCDLRLYSPILKVVEARGPIETEQFNNEISLAIGRSIQDLENCKDEELQDFRRNIMDMVGECVRGRQAYGLASLACHQHPPDLEPSSILPSAINKRLDNGFLMVTVWYNNSQSVNVRVTWDTYPDGVIAAALRRLSPQPQANHQANASPRRVKVARREVARDFTGSDDYSEDVQTLTASSTLETNSQSLKASKNTLIASNTLETNSQSLKAAKTILTPSKTPLETNSQSLKASKTSLATNSQTLTPSKSNNQSLTPTKSNQNNHSLDIQTLAASKNTLASKNTPNSNPMNNLAHPNLSKHTPISKRPSDTHPDLRFAPYSTDKRGDRTPKDRTPRESSGAQRYALKVSGTNEYLLVARPITQYKAIRLWLSRGKTPNLSLVSRGELYASLSASPLHPKTSGHPIAPWTNATSTASPEISLWHPSMDGRLKVHILRGCNLIAKDAQKIYVKAGVYHGSESLCCLRETKRVSASKPEWDEWTQFDFPIQEIPRAAKLCIALCSDKQTDRKRKREKVEDTALFWGNLCLFDHRGRLVHGKVKIPLLPSAQTTGGQVGGQGGGQSSEFINPLGLTSYRESATLEVGFERRFEQNVVFPDAKQMEDYARYIIKLDSRSTTQEPNTAENDLTAIQTIAEKDPLTRLSMEDRETLWRRRAECPAVPHSLPKLLEAVRWSSRDHFSQLYLLLGKWGTVPVSVALELLQARHPDPRVRSHAVGSLTTLQDEELGQYLLQLVLILKQEVLLDSALLRLLLRRALANPSLGHYLFWLLRSDAHTWASNDRASAVLEVYCRGLGRSGVQRVAKQALAIDTLARIAQDVKDTAKDKTQYLREQLGDTETLRLIQHMPSPLLPGVTLGALNITDCRVLDSARRPLRLVWQNPTPMAQLYSLTHGIIFKSGEDLRQDMLTLQVIGTLANLWNSEGLDLRMTPYACLATGHEMGVIEMVRDARTVYSIQRETRLGAIQVDSSQLYKWIRLKNSGLRLDQAIDNFTRSCAGYCVATFVLGIGDRHPDNIMVNQEGIIFHIDFGHFLGNFKKKFGIPRERVPFVLTPDFLFVIARGADNPKESAEFRRFQELCGEAYLALRKHTHLIINLFILSVSAGMPELQTTEDIEYLRTTLAVDMSQEKALEYFQGRFCEAYGGAWTTKLDWFFHSVKHR